MKHLLSNLSPHNKQETFEKIMAKLWAKSSNGTELAKLSKTERPLIISQLIQDSINGGGIKGFFYNNANSLTNVGLEAFQTIGLLKVYEIFKKAVETFPKQPIPDQIEYCRAILEALPDENETDEKWDELTDEFYALETYILDGNLEYAKNNFSKIE
ncbi:MAG: DUF4375 domain-containing protein [Crocinitomix sp.]|nr:DUF4375 domain-containing protein [Crocinitomix sp.]